MSTANFYASYVGIAENRNHDYYTCRNADSGYDVYAGCTVGQLYQALGVWYYTYRGFLYFDTSGIPNDAIITGATITFTSPLLGYPDRNFNIIIRGASSASNPLVLDDYDLTHYNGDDLGKLTSGPPYYQSFTLNDLGIAHINTSGTTQFVLLSERDIDNIPPTGNEIVHYDAHIVHYEIKLTITYFEPTEAPTVETINEECEDRQSTTLTAVGEITGTGDGYTYRGFEYYQYTEEGEYDSSMYAVREIGRFATPVIYRMTLYGLKPLTCYWIRAFAGNVFGIGYGDWVLCCTTAVVTHTYDIYEEDNSGPDADGTYAGGNTISFYVRKVGGKWSKKYGPYTSDQVDIAVADVMIEGTGKYQVKFESGVLTGISTQVMCKLDIKAR